MKKTIQVDFIDFGKEDYVWVKPVPKPPTGGHKALKNEDFIDHDDLMFRLSFYKQITSRRLRDRATVIQSEYQTPGQEAFNKDMGLGTRHVIPDVPRGPIRHVGSEE